MTSALEETPPILSERVHANGLDFHVRSCGEGDRLALLLHGFPECAYSWRHQMPALARLGYRVWAPDLRGYGATERPQGLSHYAIEHLMEDAGSLIDASGARSAVLFGHDWGGVIAWSFAMRKIRPLDGLVIMNGPHPGNRGEQKLSWRQLSRFWYVLFFQLPFLPELILGRGGCEAVGRAFVDLAVDPSCFDEQDIRVFRETAGQPGALTAMVNYYRGLFRGGGLRRQRALGFPVIETPTLVVWGTEDPILPPESTDGFVDFVTDLTLRMVPGVSHWVQQEAPERVNALVEAWLEGKEVPVLDANSTA
jgi:pimeloyl-ACP methyl ester carboxylesterase